MPQGLKAQSVDGLTANETYDFAALAQQSTTINWGEDYTGFTDNSPKYMGDINGTSLQGRFATGSKYDNNNNPYGWFLRTNKTPIGLWGRKKLAFCGMWNGDRVRVTLAQGGIKFLEANSAKMNGSLVTEGQTVNTGTFVFAAARNGDVIIECTDNYTTITKVEFFYSGNGHSGDWTVSFNPSSINLEGGQTYRTNANVTPSWVTPTFTSSDNRVATVDENGFVTAHRKGTATITAKMDVGPEGNQYSHHSTAEMTVNVTSNEPVEPTYSYDPAVEIYDLFYVTTQDISSTNLTGAGFPLDFDNLDAQYLTNLQGGMALNNRIAISQVIHEGNTVTPWTLENHSGLKSRYNWHNLAICNLKEGDRVVIQLWSGEAKFSSKAENLEYNGCAAFKDVQKNGDFDEGDDEYVTCGMSVESQATYVITEDGHLDIALAADAIICKITIYGDHQARMVDRYGNTPGAGNTSYFDTTGQLEAKHHIVPGGLHVYVGNEDDAQHAEVVMTDKGPASFVYDGNHFKMARTSSWGNVNVSSELPVTGTYYKFVPDVSGTMTVRLKANSITYRSYGIAGNAAYDQAGTPNEMTGNVQCPYYLMQQNGNSPQQKSTQSKGNGADLTFSTEVTAGQTYYIYGWWQDGTNSDNLSNYYCGVAELIDVTFKPTNYIYPLAKWVESGATADKLSNLATVYGYSDVCIKKKSDNIASCTVALDGGTLKVTDISYVAGANPGGTVLIKVGDKDNDADPVFALTIAYDASFNQASGAVRSEGHSWNFSDKSLNGLKWTNRDSQEATVTPFGTSTDANSLLSEEINKGDWTFNYRVKSTNGTTHDPRFLNNYDMEGDNADMIWDTEGLIFKTGSNQSCINNEFGGVVDHSKTGTRNDPDRYVGILPGGSFTIPALKKGDRVEIFMGSGDGSGANACKFNITGALDAIGNAIDPADIYNGGGSPWEYNKGGESRYRGAYQFISTGGDMTFTMNGGSMTKLYSIKIYKGAKTSTVDCTRNQSQTYNGEVYDGYTYSFNNDWNTTTPAKSAITLHYRGKGERLRTPTVVHTSGNISTGSDNLFYAEVGDNNAPFIFYKSKKEDYGMFRMRVEDLELGNKYVADYALQNITVGYLIKKNYPYTWDFTDLTGYVETNARISGERTNVVGYDPRTIDEDEAYEIEFMNNSVGENVKAVEQWKSYAKSGDIPAGYGLQINNEPYGGGCMWAGGQLYAGEQAFDETFGLSILPPLNSDGNTDVNYVYNGGVRICAEGLCLTGGNWRILIPKVGGQEVASVYIRAKQVGSRDITAGVGNAETAFTYVGTATDGTGDKIYAVTGTGDDMTLFFNNLIIKKIAVSQDTKTVNKLGYATESRNVEIDPELMGYMTGTGLKAYTVTNVTYGDKAGDKASVTLTEIPSDNVMGPATSGDHKAYIIYNTDETKAVSILSGGFHLFVPDMHDISSASKHKKSILETEEGNNHLRSHINSGPIPQTEVIERVNPQTEETEEVNYTNYLMNYKYIGPDGEQHEGPEAFYRAASGASLGNNKAYLQLLTEKVKPSEANGNNGAKFAIIFVNEEQGTETTSLDGVKSTETLSGDNAIYTLSGVKVSKPEKGGIYVKNGKKFIVK